MEHFRLKIAGGEPVAQLRRLSSHYADVSDRIFVVAWQGHRGEKLHLSEDAELIASELNREWPQHSTLGSSSDRRRNKSPCNPGGTPYGPRSLRAIGHARELERTRVN